MSELLNLMERVIAMTEYFNVLPSTRMLVARTLNGFYLNDRHLTWGADPTYMSFKPNEVIYTFCQAEKREMARVLSPMDFDGAEQPNFYYHPDLETMVSQCLNPYATVLPAQLPNGLRPRQAPAVNQPLPPLPPSRHGGGNPPARNGGGNPNNGNNHRADNQSNGSGEGRRNNNLPQPLQSFWTGVPEARRREGIERWLISAGSNTVACLRHLGLTGNDCGQFHLRGTCSSGNCNRNHRVHNPPRNGVDTVCRLLRTGCQQSA